MAHKKNESKGLKNDERTGELAELLAIAKLLSGDDFAFLLSQARILYSNAQLYSAGTESAAEESAAAHSRGGKSGRKSKETDTLPEGESGKGGGLRIEKSQRGSSFHIVRDGKWKMFSEAEMLVMVKISKGKESDKTLGRKLYHWLEAERPDAFPDLAISGPGDEALAELAALLRAKFAVRETQ